MYQNDDSLGGCLIGIVFAVLLLFYIGGTYSNAWVSDNDALERAHEIIEDESQIIILADDGNDIIFIHDGENVTFEIQVTYKDGTEERMSLNCKDYLFTDLVCKLYD